MSKDKLFFLQILMLSGIGPGDHLKYHGIPVKVDLPVGYGMQSHVGVGEIIFTVEVVLFPPENKTI